MKVTALPLWTPIEWHIWEEQNALPEHIPQWIWDNHQRHNAAMLFSALGIHKLHCFDCKYTWTRREDS